MGASASVELKVTVSGLTNQDNDIIYKFTHGDTPAEFYHQYAVIGNSAADLKIGDIDEQKLRGVLIIAKSGNVGILVNDDGTGTPSLTEGNQVLVAGEACYINLSGSIGGLEDTNVIRIIGSVATAAIEYFCWGE